MPQNRSREKRKVMSEPIDQRRGSEAEQVGAITVELRRRRDAAADEEEAVLFLPRACTDLYEDSAPQSPAPVYNKDAKVLVNVTVEGSPGPIRTVVKLGSNVEDTIRLVINKYNEEGRTPRLDKDASTTSQLHHSYFSLDSLSKSDLMGDVGSRSFYLRKGSDSRSGDVSTSSNRPDALYLHFLPSFVDRKIKKIMRRTRNCGNCLDAFPELCG